MFIATPFLLRSRGAAHLVRGAPDPIDDGSSPEDEQEDVDAAPLRGRDRLGGGPRDPVPEQTIADRFPRDPDGSADREARTPRDRSRDPLLWSDRDQLDDARSLGSIAPIVLDHLAGQLDPSQDEDPLHPGLCRLRSRHDEIWSQLLHRVEATPASLMRHTMGNRYPLEGVED